MVVRPAAPRVIPARNENENPLRTYFQGCLCGAEGSALDCIRDSVILVPSDNRISAIYFTRERCAKPNLVTEPCSPKPHSSDSRQTEHCDSDPRQLQNCATVHSQIHRIALLWTHPHPLLQRGLPVLPVSAHLPWSVSDLCGPGIPIMLFTSV